MPAEAACFLIVEPLASAEARGARIIACILSIAAQRESASVLSDQPNSAGALTIAVRGALQDAGVESSAVGMIWSDLNGESYRAREWAYAEIRLGFQTHTALIHPADCHGDLGAATDANLFGLAALCHGTGWSEGRPLLVFAGSEYGLRAAAILESADHGFLQVSKDIPRPLSLTFELPDPPATDYTKSTDPPRAYFELRLREGHRDDLAALYYQRRSILHGPLPWTRLRDVEQRTLNHLDAVVASGPASMASTADALRSDEEGLCFAGALMVGVLPNVKNLRRVSMALEVSSPARIAGIEAALLHAPDSEELNQFVVDNASHDDPAVCAMAVRVAARRRLDIGERIRSLLDSTDVTVLAAAAGACWRLGLFDCTTELAQLLSHASMDVRRAALGSLLVLSRDWTASFCRSRLRDNDRFGGDLARCLGIAGNPTDARLLLDRMNRAPSDTSSVEGLGILGVARVCPHLIEAMDSSAEELTLAAARAMDLISGLHATEQKAVARERGMIWRRWRPGTSSE
jgi:hypothetical protein